MGLLYKINLNLIILISFPSKINKQFNRFEPEF